MEQTLIKVKNLGKFINKYGEDAFISQTISKMLTYKIQTYNKEIMRLNNALIKFEQTYKKESTVFFEEFKNGRFGDEFDFIEWSSLFQMRNRLIEKKKALESMM